MGLEANSWLDVGTLLYWRVKQIMAGREEKAPVTLSIYAKVDGELIPLYEVKLPKSLDSLQK